MKRWKRQLAFWLVMLMLLPGVAAHAANNTAENPFETNTLSCERFRIPALWTLQNGSVLAAADLRWNHGTDAPQNLDTAVAVSPDGRGNWNYSVPNRFDDYADGAGSKQSAAFIDSALLQSESGRVFLLTDAFLSGTGYPNAKEGSGCNYLNGVPVIALAKKDNNDYAYCVGPFENGAAPVLSMATGKRTGYTVDEEYRLYRNGELLTMPQLDENGNQTGENAAQSIFYAASDLHVFPTPFLFLRHSDDGGKTWSAPQLLNPMVKKDDEAFLGVCPGRGFSVRVNGRERLLFPVYSGGGGKEHALTIYSDDGGETWLRGEAVESKRSLKKTSESQIVSLPDGTLRLFSRNGSHFVSFCDSTDGGISWTKARPDYGLLGTKNCMVSFLNTDRVIDGKPVILCSMASDVKGRANGVIRVGLVEEGGRIRWLPAYHVNEGFFAYSCLSELADGTVALLFEDEAAHINYRLFALGDDGAVSALDGENVQMTQRLPLRAKVLSWYASLMQKWEQRKKR